MGDLEGLGKVSREPLLDTSPSHTPPLDHILISGVVTKPGEASSPIPALPAAAWSCSSLPCKAPAGCSPAGSLEDGGTQRLADELPRKPCAEGALDAPRTSWSRPGSVLFGQAADPRGCSPGFSQPRLAPQQERSRAGCTARQMEELSTARVGRRRE